jgi:hypothetical protein
LLGIIAFMASREEGAGDVRFHLPVPLFARHLDDRLVEDAASVVDEQVQLAEFLNRQAHRLLGAAVLGDVREERHETRLGQFFHGGIDTLGDNLGAAGMRSV